jgi:hypothetical protein
MDADDISEDALVAELRNLFTAVDPVPPLVSELAAASLGWRRLDSDLAELLVDSALDAEQLVGARGQEAAVRSVSFRSGSTTIDLEVQDGATLLLLGQLSPPSVLAIEVQSIDGRTVASPHSDELGRFRASLPADIGTIRLLLGSEQGGERRAVHTSWITV